MKILSNYPLFVALAFSWAMASGCSTIENSENLITIQYNLDRTFSIVGSEMTDVNEDHLGKMLKQHYRKNPDSTYEVLALPKSQTPTLERIIEIFDTYGIPLKHFWVPYGRFLQNAPKSRHGHVIDILSDNPTG